MTANLLSAIPTGVGQESACKLTSCRLAPGAAADDDDGDDDPRTRKGPVHQRASAADLLQLHLQNKAVLSPQSIVTVTRGAVSVLVLHVSLSRAFEQGCLDGTSLLGRCVAAQL